MRMSAEELKIFQKFGAAGGRKAAKRMTPEARSERARKAVAAREKKRKAKGSA